jgi:hypothetical protein
MLRLKIENTKNNTVSAYSAVSAKSGFGSILYWLFEGSKDVDKVFS